MPTTSPGSTSKEMSLRAQKSVAGSACSGCACPRTRRRNAWSCGGICERIAQHPGRNRTWLAADLVELGQVVNANSGFHCKISLPDPSRRQCRSHLGPSFPRTARFGILFLGVVPEAGTSQRKYHCPFSRATWRGDDIMKRNNTSEIARGHHTFRRGEQPNEEWSPSIKRKSRCSPANHLLTRCKVSGAWESLPCIGFCLPFRANKRSERSRLRW